MTTTMGAKGQVVVPKAIRDEVGLQPGDPIEFELRDGEVVLSRGSREMRPLGGRYAGTDLLTGLMEDHAREVAKDLARDRR
jgi:AbrB family looped-hinge helix DNA binding protein